MSAQSLVDLRDERRSHRQPPGYRRAPSCRRVTCARGRDARSATPAGARSRAGNRSPRAPSWSGTVEQKPTETRRCGTWFNYRGQAAAGRAGSAGWLGAHRNRKSSEPATTSLVPAHPKKHGSPPAQRCHRAPAGADAFSWSSLRLRSSRSRPWPRSFDVVMTPVIERTTSHSTRTARSRSAFAITLTDDSAIAAAATTGDNNRPENGYSTPAASGMPAVL